jgi:thiazole/oxazole-forming peptide maturase SagC family component
MQIELKAQRLRALPAQVIAVDGGVILKRGSLEAKISGERAEEVVQIILDVVSRGEAGREQVTERFAATDRPEVEALLDRLLERRLLIQEDASAAIEPAAEESPLDVFYWNFEQRAKDVAERLNSRKIFVVGVNAITLRLVQSMHASGVDSIEVVDYPMLRNLRFYRPDGMLDQARWGEKAPTGYEEWASAVDASTVECIVATSDFGGAHAMRQWNQMCVSNRFHFFPVVLEKLIGQLGPLVVPGETACFECLRGRQNSHLENPEIARAAEVVAFEGQSVVGYHPSMASMLGDIAAFELTKLYGGALPLRKVGTLIQVNLLQPSISSHKVLKLPRCFVCGPLMTNAPTTALKSTFLPGNRPESMSDR